MKIQSFKLQDFLTKHEHSAKYSLSSADCDGFKLQQMLTMADAECHKLWETLHLSYTHPKGHPLLRKEIALQYNGIDKDEVLVTSSTEEALYIAFQTLLVAGDHVICCPGYEPHYRIPSSIGANVDFWEPKYQNGSWTFNIDDLQKKISKKTKLIVLSFPHNPTGSIITRNELERLCAIAEQQGITIISDEVFRGVERKSVDTLKSASEVSSKAITCGGLSKVYGAAGLRIGWMIVHDHQLRNRIFTYHYYTNVCSSAPSELLALIAVRNTEKILEANRQKIQKNLAVLSEFFERHSSLFRWSTPSGGTIGLAEVIGRNVDDFCEQAVVNTGIMIVPSTVLDHGKNHIRIGYGRENLPKTLQALEVFLSDK